MKSIVRQWLKEGILSAKQERIVQRSEREIRLPF